MWYMVELTAFTAPVVFGGTEQSHLHLPYPFDELQQGSPGWPLLYDWSVEQLMLMLLMVDQ